MSRRDARDLAFHILYELDFQSEDEKGQVQQFQALCRSKSHAAFELSSKNLSADDFSYMDKLRAGVRKKRYLLDRSYAPFLKDWHLHRLPWIDKEILRIGLYEMAFEKAVPEKVAINEAVRLAEVYTSQKSRQYINAVLGNFLRSGSVKTLQDLPENASRLAHLEFELLNQERLAAESALEEVKAVEALSAALVDAQEAWQTKSDELFGRAKDLERELPGGRLPRPRRKAIRHDDEFDDLWEDVPEEPEEIQKIRHLFDVSSIQLDKAKGLEFEIREFRPVVQVLLLKAQILNARVQAREACLLKAFESNEESHLERARHAADMAALKCLKESFEKGRRLPTILLAIQRGIAYSGLLLPKQFVKKPQFKAVYKKPRKYSLVKSLDKILTKPARYTMLKPKLYLLKSDAKKYLSYVEKCLDEFLDSGILSGLEKRSFWKTQGSRALLIRDWKHLFSEKVLEEKYNRLSMKELQAQELLEKEMAAQALVDTQSDNLKKSGPRRVRRVRLNFAKHIEDANDLELAIRNAAKQDPLTED